MYPLHKSDVPYSNIKYSTSLTENVIYIILMSESIFFGFIYNFMPEIIDMPYIKINVIIYYSKTPLIRIPGDPFNRFELGGFRIRGD